MCACLCILIGTFRTILTLLRVLNGNKQIRRAVDNYQVLAPELVANPAALVRSLLCLLASIWQHAKVPAELVDRMTNDPDDASALRTYLWHIGPAYKGTFLYLASLAAFMSKSAGQDEAEVSPVFDRIVQTLPRFIGEPHSHIYCVHGRWWVH